MPNAIISTSIFAPPHDSTGFTQAIASACTVAGMGNSIANFTNNTEIHNVFEIVGDQNSAKGRVYFDIYTDGSYVYTWLYDTFNISNNSGTFGVKIKYYSQTYFNFNSGVNIHLTSINHPELRAIVIRQDTIHITFGIIRPAIKPAWWDENIYPYFFMHTIYGREIGEANSNFMSYLSLDGGMNPWGVSVSSYPSYYCCNLLQSNAIGNPPLPNLKRDIINGVILLSSYDNDVAQGIAGKFSDDLVLVAAKGLNFLDVLQVIPGSEEYTLITPGSAGGTNCGVAIRTL